MELIDADVETLRHFLFFCVVYFVCIGSTGCCCSGYYIQCCVLRVAYRRVVRSLLARVLPAYCAFCLVTRCGAGAGGRHRSPRTSNKSTHRRYRDAPIYRYRLSLTTYLLVDKLEESTLRSGEWMEGAHARRAHAGTALFFFPPRPATTRDGRSAHDHDNT
jgi:hypothetical protein